MKHIFLQFVASFLGCDHFKNFGNKRLNGTDITTTKTFSSKARCIQACYGNHGCLAVNAIATDDVISCEMMRGLTKELEMVDDPSSTLFIKSTCLCKFFITDGFRRVIVTSLGNAGSATEYTFPMAKCLSFLANLIETNPKHCYNIHVCIHRKY